MGCTRDEIGLVRLVFHHFNHRIEPVGLWEYKTDTDLFDGETVRFGDDRNGSIRSVSLVLHSRDPVYNVHFCVSSCAKPPQNAVFKH